MVFASEMRQFLDSVQLDVESQPPMANNCWLSRARGWQGGRCSATLIRCICAGISTEMCHSRMAMSMAARDGAASSRRRSCRERLTVRVELARALHHSAQPAGGRWSGTTTLVVSRSTGTQKSSSCKVSGCQWNFGRPLFEWVFEAENFQCFDVVLGALLRGGVELVYHSSCVR